MYKRQGFQAAEGGYIFIGGALSSTQHFGATLYIQAGTIEIGAAASSDTFVNFQTISADTLVLDNAAEFDGLMEGFGTGDIIDLKNAQNVVVDGYETTGSFEGVLHLHYDHNGSTYAADLSFHGANYTQDSFVLVSDGNDGTNILFDQPVVLGPTQLVTTPSVANHDFYWPSFSRDGSKLAFWHNPGVSGDDQIIIKSLTGGSDVVISTGDTTEGDNSPITFSWDGQYVAFASSDPTLHPGNTDEAIYLANTTTGALLVSSPTSPASDWNTTLVPSDEN